MNNLSTLELNPAPRATVVASVLASAIFGLAFTGCMEAHDNHGSTDSAGTAAHDHAAMPSRSVDGGEGDAGGDHLPGSHTQTTRLELASTPEAIEPGATATLRLRIIDVRTGRPVSEFERGHEKLMHLIVVSKDLSWFNHLHPEYQGNGVFTVDAVLPRDGAYTLYADYTPKGGSQEVARHELSTKGSSTMAPAELVADRTAQDGWMVRRTVARPEGEPDASGGGEYQVAMMPMPSRIVAGQDVMLHFQVRDAQGEPVADLEPYLGAPGHAVLLSSDTKTYLHMHPMERGMDHGAGDHEGHGAHDSRGNHTGHGAARAGGSDVMFHTTFPAAGLYKIWGQFQHRGKIITAAFVLQAASAVEQ